MENEKEVYPRWQTKYKRGDVITLSKSLEAEAEVLTLIRQDKELANLDIKKALLTKDFEGTRKATLASLQNGREYDRRLLKFYALVETEIPEAKYFDFVLKGNELVVNNCADEMVIELYEEMALKREREHSHHEGECENGHPHIPAELVAMIKKMGGSITAIDLSKFRR